MIPKKVSYFSRVTAESLTDAFHVLDQMLSDLYRTVVTLWFGAPTDKDKLENFDAVWLVAMFTAANTNTSFQHGLSRIPVGLIQAEAPLKPGEVLVSGVISFVSATSTVVTLQSSGANKIARVILF